MVIEAGLAAWYVIAWATRKARRAAGRLDAEVDQVIDGTLDRLHEVVAAKLGNHPVLAELVEEAEAAGDAGEISDLTHRRVELELTAAAGKDDAFGRAVAESVARLREVEQASGRSLIDARGLTVFTGDARARAGGGGIAIAQAGSVNINQVPPGHVHVLGPLAVARSAYQQQVRHIAPPDLTDPATYGTFDMRGEFDELLHAIDREGALFESFEIRSGVVTFSVRLGAGRQRVLLRVDGDAYLGPGERQRFIQEVALAKEFSSSHLHVARILGGGFTSLGYPFVMQLIDGTAAPVRPPLPVAKIIDIGSKLADALDVAHKKRMSFGIIEPSHMLLKDGDPLLIFPHLPIFTPPNEGIQAASRDVFSLCVTLFSMLPQGLHILPSAGSASLDARVRELLRSGMQAEPELRPSAAILREGFYELLWETAENWDDTEFPKKIPIAGRDGAPAAEIIVCIGDLLDEPSDIVVSFSDTFDTDTEPTGDPEEVIISPGSLQGQLTSRIYGGDTAALDRDLNRGLAAKRFIGDERREDKKLGKLRRYEIGTTVVLERGERKIFAVAVSRMDNNLTASSSYDSLARSLQRLWREIGDRDCAAVAMPIIGSGLARVGASSLDLFELIRSSFRAHSQARRVCQQLRIVIHPSDSEAIQSIGAALTAQGF